MSVDEFKARNAKVEADKAWETSWTRKVVITIATYVIITAYLALLGVEKFYLHACVPAGGYFLSTLTLPFLKAYWIKTIYKPKGV